jgi:replication factor A1
MSSQAGIAKKIKDIKSGDRNLNVEGVVTSAGEVTAINLRSGEIMEKQDLGLADDTGQINMTLWGEQAGKFRVGDRVRITNGYVNTFKGINSVGPGKFGKIEVL